MTPRVGIIDYYHLLTPFFHKRPPRIYILYFLSEGIIKKLSPRWLIEVRKNHYLLACTTAICRQVMTVTINLQSV